MYLQLGLLLQLQGLLLHLGQAECILCMACDGQRKGAVNITERFSPARTHPLELSPRGPPSRSPRALKAAASGHRAPCDAPPLPAPILHARDASSSLAALAARSRPVGSKLLHLSLGVLRSPAPPLPAGPPPPPGPGGRESPAPPCPDSPPPAGAEPRLMPKSQDMAPPRRRLHRGTHAAPSHARRLRLGRAQAPR